MHARVEGLYVAPQRMQCMLCWQTLRHTGGDASAVAARACVKHLVVGHHQACRHLIVLPVNRTNGFTEAASRHWLTKHAPGLEQQVSVLGALLFLQQ
jgi:hypothetical protein